MAKRSPLPLRSSSRIKGKTAEVAEEVVQTNKAQVVRRRKKDQTKKARDAKDLDLDDEACTIASSDERLDAAKSSEAGSRHEESQVVVQNHHKRQVVKSES